MSGGQCEYGVQGYGLGLMVCVCGGYLCMWGRGCHTDDIYCTIRDAMTKGMHLDEKEKSKEKEKEKRKTRRGRAPEA